MAPPSRGNPPGNDPRGAGPNDRRIIVGQLPGELGKCPAPSLFFEGNILKKHIEGRAEATAQMLIIVAYLQSVGRMRINPTVYGTGAAYQDIVGSRRYPRAHRLPCNPRINGWDLPDFAVSNNVEFQRLLFTPLAVTDPVNFLVNYADRLFEIVAAGPLIRTVAWVLQHQRRGGPLEKNLVRDAIMLQALPDYQRAYDQAIETAEENFRKLFAPPTKEADQRAAARLRQFWEKLGETGPQSRLVNERIRDMALQDEGPTHYGDAPQIVLTACKEIGVTYCPALVIEDRMEEYAARLEAAKSQQPIEEASRRLKAAAATGAAPDSPPDTGRTAASGDESG